MNIRKRFVFFVSLCCSLVMFSQASYAGGIYDMTSPLQGQWTLRTVTHSFGENWAADRYCGGLVKKHNATDVQAWAYEAVYAAEAGVVKDAGTDEDDGGWVTILHTPSGEPAFTTVYWHVVPTVSVNTSVSEGQWIGNIADLDSDTHFHFGVRKASYSSRISRAGALPQTNCGGYPAFPEYFINPISLSYHNK